MRFLLLTSFDLATDAVPSLYSAQYCSSKKMVSLGTACKCTLPLKLEVNG